MPSHRQRSYEARRLAEAHALGPEDVLIGRAAFQQARDVLYQIEAALQDIDADLAGGADPEEYRQALWHLYRAASEAKALVLEPKAVG